MTFFWFCRGWDDGHIFYIVMKFSERYGFVEPKDVLKRGFLDEEGVAGLCTCFDLLYDDLIGYGRAYSYVDLEIYIWCFYLNKRKNDYPNKAIATEYLKSSKHEWFKKFDLIEFVVEYLRGVEKHGRIPFRVTDRFVHSLNSSFIRLNYSYRVVDDQIVEISDDGEIATIEKAEEQGSTIKTHLSSALRLLSDRSTPDYRNSIKESISAVEVLCREITGETTLGAALKELEKKGLTIPFFLKSGFEKLYVYTNDGKTGIRHALMEDKETPRYEEAKFMVVACSAFINYIQEKRSKL